MFAALPVCLLLSYRVMPSLRTMREVREVRALGRRADREARARWWVGRGWGGSSLRAAFRLLEFQFPSRRMGQGGAHAIPPDEGSCWDWGGDPGG